jgi:hypothetical protein
MMKLIYILLVVLGVSSCYKEDPQPKENKPIIVYPYVTDTVTDSIPTLKGTTWVLTGVRIGGIGNPQTVSDTLQFITNTSYKYNGYSSKYSLYYTGGGFNMTINGTSWGNLSGTIYEYNLKSGKIEGLKFIDITPGSSNQTNYFLWISKI